MKFAIEVGSGAVMYMYMYMCYNDWSKHSNVNRVGLTDSQTAW
jgi:hypothetical protein